MEFFQPVLDYLKGNPALSYLYHFIIAIIFIVFVAVLIVSLWQYILYPIYKYVLLPIYRFFVAIDLTINSVQEMKKELTHNGGSSFKDKLFAIHEELLQLHRNMRKVEEKQRIIMNCLSNSDIGFFETDSKGQCISITPHYCELTSLSEEELLGFNWILAIHPEDKNLVLEEWNNCTELKRVFKMKYRYLNRRNSIITNIDCSATPIRVDNEIIGFLGAVTKTEQND